MQSRAVRLHVTIALCAAVIAAMSVAALFAPPALDGLMWLIVPLAVPAIPAHWLSFLLGLGGGPEGLPYYTDLSMYALTFLLWLGILEGVRALWGWRSARARTRQSAAS